MSILEFISVSAREHFCRTMNGAHKLHPGNERLSFPVLISSNTSLPVCINGSVLTPKNKVKTQFFYWFTFSALCVPMECFHWKQTSSCFFSTTKKETQNFGSNPVEFSSPFWFFYSFTHTDPVVPASSSTSFLPFQINLCLLFLWKIYKPNSRVGCYVFCSFFFFTWLVFLFFNF